MYRLRIAPAELDRDRGLAGARNAADEPDRRLRHAAKTRQRSRQARGKLVLRLALALALALTVARALTAALARTRLLLVRAREAIACCLVFHSAPPSRIRLTGQLLQMEGRRPGEAPGRASSSERVAGIEPALQPWRGRLRTTTTHPRS